MCLLCVLCIFVCICWLLNNRDENSNHNNNDDRFTQAKGVTTEIQVQEVVRVNFNPQKYARDLIAPRNSSKLLG